MNVVEKFLNPSWRLQNLYSIVDKESKKILFKPNRIQGILNADDSRRKMILKARQFGISTNEIIRLFDHTIFNRNITTVILAHEQDSIKKLFRIVRRAYDFMDESLRPKLDRGGGSKYELFFPDINSRIYCDLESRGDTIQRLHVSEMAFMNEPDRVKATLQAVPISTGHVTIETTPNGMNFFYDLWTDTKTTYKKYFFPWYFHDEYQMPTLAIDKSEDEIELISKAGKYGIKISDQQIAFRRFKINELGTLFFQEYPEDDNTCFLSTGESAMDLFKVKEKMSLSKKPILETQHIKIFSDRESKRYVCGADTAEGKGGDYSVATIFSVEDREQVAQIRGHFKPYEFAHEIYRICERYSSKTGVWPLLAVERNNHGHAVLLELEHHINYPNLYRTEDGSSGWVTDKVTRPIMIDAFIDGVENGTVKINDHSSFSECLTLVSKNGKIEAVEGKHDDCIIAGAIAVQLLSQFKSLDVYNNIDKKIFI